MKGHQAYSVITGATAYFLHCTLITDIILLLQDLSSSANEVKKAISVKVEQEMKPLDLTLVGLDLTSMLMLAVKHF